MHGRGQQPVEEPELDVGRHRDPARQPREHRALDDRARARRSRGRTRRRGTAAGPAPALVPLAITASSIERQHEGRHQQLRAAELHASARGARAPRRRGPRRDAHRVGAAVARRALEVRAGDRDEDVVERRRLDLDELDLDVGARRARGSTGRDRRLAGGGAQRRRASARRVVGGLARSPSAGQRLARARGALAGRRARRARSAPPRAPSATPACPRRRACRAR